MNGKVARKIRKALFKLNIDIYPTKYGRHKRTGQLFASEGRRMYQNAKRIYMAGGAQV